MFACGILKIHLRNPKSWALESVIKVKESKIKKDWNRELKFSQRLECSSWNTESTAWNPDCHMRRCKIVLSRRYVVLMKYILQCVIIYASGHAIEEKSRLSKDGNNALPLIIC